MSQLNLAILPQLVYRPNQFLLHSGVKSCLTECVAAIERSVYTAAFVYGGARVGKTHFAIRLADELVAKGLLPRIIDGVHLLRFLNEEFPSLQVHAEDVVIVDDAHKFFLATQPGESGPLVNFVEKLRSARAHVVFTSCHFPDEFPCDPHIMSRLMECVRVEITDPDEAALPELVTIMARQRGIQLTGKKVDFLERRMRRSVASIEEYMEKLVHLSSVLGKKVSLSLLGDAL